MNEDFKNPYFTGLTSGLSSGQAFGAPKNNFQMSQGGIMGAVGSGALSGSAAGPVGAFVGGVTGGVTSFFKQDKALKEQTDNVNTSFNAMTDAYGRPVYNGGEFAQGLQDLSGLTEATRPGAHALRPKRRRQMERKALDLHTAIQQGQQNFNQADSNFRNQMLSRQEYLERLNKNTGNLY